MRPGGINPKRRRGPAAELAAVERHSLRMPPMLISNTSGQWTGRPCACHRHASPAGILNRPGFVYRSSSRVQPASLGPVVQVCGSTIRDRRVDPGRLIPRSLGGCGDPLCVCPLRRSCHHAYDRGELDLPSYLEPTWRRSLHTPSGTWADWGAAENQQPSRSRVKEGDSVRLLRIPAA